MKKPDCAWVMDDLNKIENNGITAMSTFSCGGGSSMGYKRAGCTIVAANDIDPEMAWHYKHNLNPPLYYLCPIKELLTADLLREGQSKQVLSDLFFDYLDLVERLKPKVAIAENVKGMLLGNAKGYTKLVMARFKEIGYRPQLFLINAADCGVPQRRERVFFCSLRNDLDAPLLKLDPRHRWISAGEATRDVQALTAAERVDTKPVPEDVKYWAKTKPGESYGNTKQRLGEKPSSYCRVRGIENAPISTLTTHCKDTLHWSEMRNLTFREWKRLGSFPDDYHAKTDKIGKYMIGMSVPPKMAEVVARAVIDQWLK